MRVLLAFIAAVVAQTTVYYDFANGCANVASIDSISKILTFDGNLYALSELTHQVMEISRSKEGVVSCRGLPPTGAPANTFSRNMDVSCDGTFYISNSGNSALDIDGSAYKFNIYEPNPSMTLLFIVDEDELLSGVAVDTVHQQVFFSSEIFGRISQYSIIHNTVTTLPGTLLTTGTGHYPFNPQARANNSNLFSVPLGISSLYLHDNTLYATNIDRGLVLGIDVTGGAVGAINTVASYPQHSSEGLFVSGNGRFIYTGSIWRNGTSVSPDIAGVYQGGVLPGNTFFRYEMKTGVSTRYYDDQFGCVTSITDAKGALGGAPGRMFVASSGFDNWPLGRVRTGEVPFNRTGAPGYATGPFTLTESSPKIFLVDV